jgi:hypothetical protein
MRLRAFIAAGVVVASVAVMPGPLFHFTEPMGPARSPLGKSSGRSDRMHASRSDGSSRDATPHWGLTPSYLQARKEAFLLLEQLQDA